MSHESLKKLLSIGNRFILEIRPYRLTNKAYPITSDIPNTALKLNQFFMTIARVVPEAQTEEDFHEVYWEVENPSGILEPTYYDGVTILSETTAHVLAVPTRGIHHDKKAGTSFVYTLDGDFRLVRRDVVSGIAQGEPVVIANPSGYAVGMKVGVSEYEF